MIVLIVGLVEHPSRSGEDAISTPIRTTCSYITTYWSRVALILLSKSILAWTAFNLYICLKRKKKKWQKYTQSKIEFWVEREYRKGRGRSWLLISGRTVYSPTRDCSITCIRACLFLLVYSQQIEKLADAAERNDIEEVKRLIEIGVSVNSMNKVRPSLIDRHNRNYVVKFCIESTGAAEGCLNWGVRL